MQAASTMVLSGKFSDHLPLNRQSEASARGGTVLDVSTLADWVGACSVPLVPLVALTRETRIGWKTYSIPPTDLIGQEILPYGLKPYRTEGYAECFAAGIRRVRPCTMR